MKKTIGKIFGTLALMALTAGIAVAAVFTFPINGNTVTAASADLTVNTTGKPLSGILAPGEWTENGTLNITANSNHNGALSLSVGNVTGTVCTDMILEVKQGDTVLSNTTVDVTGNITVDSNFDKHGNTLLTQRAQLKSDSTANGGDCNWDETVRFAN